MEPKQVGFAQLDVKFGAVKENHDAFRKLLPFPQKLDLLVLPELAFTGYDFVDREELVSLAEPFREGQTGVFLQQLAAELSCNIVAGYAEQTRDHVYNSAMLVQPDGQMHNYRKIHLFSRENDLFTAGDAPPPVIETSAGRIGIMICFDWFFPETARYLALQGAQIIAHPSNLVLPYCQRAMYTRSVENHVFSVTANRVGTETRADRTLVFTGESQILSPSGQVLVSAPTLGASLQSASCSIDEADIKQINPYNHLFDSRRLDLYGDVRTVTVPA